jgi:hypothetical protein
MPVDEQGREYDESWELATGLIDDINAAVVASRFGYLEEYKDANGNLQCLAILTLQPVRQSGDNWEPDGETVEQVWSTGRGWEPTEDGKAAVHESGKRRFIRTSMYGLLLARVAGLWPDIRLRGPADRAGVLDGTVWHWAREKVEYGGRLEAREHLFPNQFLGLLKAKAAATATTNWQDDLLALALSADSHGEFVKAVLANKDLVAQLKASSDYPKLRDVLDATPNGYWAKSRKDAGL